MSPPPINPLVSVVVLSYRRRDELARTLESVRRQLYQPRELIVVDNHSGDDTPAFLAAEFPEARVLALPQNLGCAGRNRGIEAAQGEFVVTLDNDVRFDSEHELEHVLRAFSENSQASALVFKVLEEDGGRLHRRDWCHPRSYVEWADREFETCYIAEGACAFHRSHFLEVGGYFEPFHIGGEGWDLALRMLDRGQRIFYAPSVRVRHALAQETRGERRPFYFLMRNYLWTAFKDYPGWRRYHYLAYGIALMTFFSLRSGNLRELFRGLADGWKSRKQLPRTLITSSGWNRVRELRANRPSWLTRLRTHSAQREP